MAAEQKREEVARRRARWARHQGGVEGSRLVFIEETWAKTNMAPLRDWASKGERLEGYAPFGHWNTVTPDRVRGRLFIAALRHDRIDAPWVFDGPVFDGPVNGNIFKTYIREVLIPTLSPGDSHRLERKRIKLKQSDHRISLYHIELDQNPFSDCDSI